MSRNEESEYVQLSRRYETGDLRFYHDGTEFEIRDISPLFDLPAGIVVDRFLKQMVELGADRTWQNDYDGYDIFQHKAERAIQEVVDHSIDRVEKCADADLVVEQIGPQAESVYRSWKSLSYSWVLEWMKIYNSLLQTETNEEIEQISTAANAVSSNLFFSDVDYESLLQCCSEG